MRKRLIILLLFVAYLIACRAQNGLFVFADRSYTERFNSAVSLYKGERSMEAYDILKKLHKDASDAMVTAKEYGYALTDADFEFSQKVMTSLLQCAYKMNLYREMKAVCNEQCEGINNYLGYYGGVTLDPARRALYYKVLADNNKSYGNLYYLQGAENATYYKNALYHYEYALKCYIMENRSVSSIIAVYEDLAQLAYIQSFYEDAITYLDHAIDYVVRPETSEKESKAGQLKHLYLLRSAKALCMARLGDYDGALKMMDSNVFPGVKTKLGKQSQPEFYRRRAKILMLRHFAEGTDIGDADKLYAEYFKAIKDSVANDFMQMTADQREQYWMIQRPFVADCYQLENNNPELLYDVTLYNKGILLQTSRSFDLLLSADEQMELTRLRLHDAELIAQGEKSNTAGDYEGQLMQRMDSDGRRKKFFSPLNHTWKDVQKALPKDGCAIEFVEYEKGGDMRFGALVLKKQGTPQFVYICNAHLLGNYYPNDGFYTLYELLKSTSGADKNPIYEDSVIWRMIWNRDLVDAIGDSRKVYFSPDGYLHQLAIEFMKPSELADVNFYRLSSTRVLIDGHSPDAKKIKDGAALILGGIVYQSYATAPEEGDRGNDAKAYELIKSKSVSYNYMPGAKEECDSIVNLRNNPSDLYLYSLNATEKAFYENSRNYPLLHISTHGYFGGDKTVYNELLASASSDVMSESVLMLSNSLTNLQSFFFDSSKKDGLLSARELACLDLSNVELVTTSACQTGLGVITADGIYGLERGFKSAGAKGMILTLWSVDVTAARLFFTSFYRHLKEGKSVHQAYVLARTDLSQPYEQVMKVRLLSMKTLSSEETEVKYTTTFNEPQHANAYILVDVWE